MARYTLDGEPTTLDDFIAANTGELDAEEIRRAADLKPGELMTLGGGAAAEFVLARLADEEPRALSDAEFSLLAQFAQAEAAFSQGYAACVSASHASGGQADCWPDASPLALLRAELKRRGVL